MVKFRLVGIENNNLPTIFKSSGLRIEQPGKTSTRQAKKYTASIVTRLRIKLSSAHTQQQPGMKGKW